MSKSASAVDKHIGTRVRMRRVELGLSQEKLATALGITFQQVQKYEKGTNRIGAGRLHEIAEALSVPILYFYDGASNSEGGPRHQNLPGMGNASLSIDHIRLLAAFGRIPNNEVRKQLLRLAETLGAGGANHNVS